MIRAAEEIGAEIAHAYGLTETYGPHTICAWKPEWDDLPAAERAQIKARQGVPYVIAGTDLRVVDHAHARRARRRRDHGRSAHARQQRDARLLRQSRRPPPKAFDGGWFHSGDLAVVHPDGYIELRDRAKDIVISGGENISSIEVEKVLADHPAVRRSRSWPRRTRNGARCRRPTSVSSPARRSRAEELIALCRERLAHFKCPKLRGVRTAAAHRHRQDPQERTACAPGGPVSGG